MNYAEKSSGSAVRLLPGRAPLLTVAAIAAAALLLPFAPGSLRAEDGTRQFAAAESEARGQATVSARRHQGYGEYLAGQIASRQNDITSAASYLLLALEKNPDDYQLLQDTFMLVAADGRQVEAVRLAKRIVAEDPDNGPANLVLIVDALGRDDLATASAIAEGLPDRGVNRILLPMLQGWLKVGEGNLQAGLESLAKLQESSGFGVLERLHAALMHDVAGRVEEAAAAYQEALDSAAQPSLRLVWLIGNFLERKGDNEAARALYDSYLETADGSGVFDPALQRLKSDSTPAAAVDNYRQGMAEALFNLAGLLNQERADRMALLQTHLALRLDPGFQVARILLGEIAEDQGRSEAAVAAYRHIDPASPLTWTARLRIADQLSLMGRTDEAVAELEALAAEWSDHYEPLFRLGNLLRSEERFEEAVTAYDRAFERLGEPQPRHWSMLYFRGIALERSDQWERAEADFQKALALEPEQPYVMNYLAYSWVEQKQNFDQAKAMLVRAVELRPTDGFIVDSLGWVYYRLGEFDKAVKHLEKAVELRPQDPVINDHLGDAYWQVGRAQEARFQWRRALSLEPEADLVPTIEAKIEKGLEVEPKKI